MTTRPTANTIAAEWITISMSPPVLANDRQVRWPCIADGLRDFLLGEAWLCSLFSDVPVILGLGEAGDCLAINADHEISIYVPGLTGYHFYPTVTE